MSGTTVRIKYVAKEVDRHGKQRIYFRKGRGKRTPLRGPIGSPEFWHDYQLASKNPDLAGQNNRGPRIETVEWLCNQYRASAEFKQLEESTKKVRRNILRRFCKENGDKKFSTLKSTNLRMLRNSMTDTPDAWNNLRKVLIQVFKFAVDEELMDSNVVRDVPKLKPKNKDGIHAWTSEDIEKFESKYPIGTKPRLAMAILLHTGQRLGDAIKLGKQHVKSDTLRFKQQKTGKNMEIPISTQLQEIIDASPTGDLTFIVTQHNRPYSPAGFGNRFRAWCDDAGLPHCSAHGLRKAAAERLALAGCTTQEIMAITGHTSLKEVERYTKNAEQWQRAKRANQKLQDINGTKTP